MTKGLETRIGALEHDNQAAGRRQVIVVQDLTTDGDGRYFISGNDVLLDELAGSVKYLSEEQFQALKLKHDVILIRMVDDGEPLGGNRL
jgi:hypothetical protein